MYDILHTYFDASTSSCLGQAVYDGCTIIGHGKAPPILFYFELYPFTAKPADR